MDLLLLLILLLESCWYGQFLFPTPDLGKCSDDDHVDVSVSVSVGVHVSVPYATIFFYDVCSIWLFALSAALSAAYSEKGTENPCEKGTEKSLDLNHPSSAHV